MHFLSVETLLTPDPYNTQNSVSLLENKTEGLKYNKIVTPLSQPKRVPFFFRQSRAASSYTFFRTYVATLRDFIVTTGDFL